MKKHDDRISRNQLSHSLREHALLVHYIINL